MTVYAVAQLDIFDRSAYERYRTRFMEVFGKFRGRLLAADENPVTVEGQWDRDKVILLSFPNSSDFYEWSLSPEYKEIAKDRRAGSEGVVLLVTGVP